MLSIEWKVFWEKGLGSCYLGWVGYLDAVKKGKFRGWLFLYRGNGREMAWSAPRWWWELAWKEGAVWGEHPMAVCLLCSYINRSITPKILRFL